MDREWIVIEEYIQYSHVEPRFIALLEENELIRIYEMNDKRFIAHDDLPCIEKYARMYYDLSINMEGIDAIHHLLDRINELQEEMKMLRNRLDFFE